MILLTLTNGYTILKRPQDLTSAVQLKDHTVVIFEDGDCLEVREKPSQIMQKIRNSYNSYGA